MAVPVVWAAPAIEDLKAILSFIARDSLPRAVQVRDKIKAAAESIGDFPFRGHVVAELGDPGCREIVVYSYRVIYDVGDTVTIVAVIHGARLLRKRALRKRRMKR
jgi:plasmid stabilization system protein ParE